MEETIDSEKLHQNLQSQRYPFIEKKHLQLQPDENIKALVEDPVEDIEIKIKTIILMKKKGKRRKVIPEEGSNPKFRYAHILKIIFDLIICINLFQELTKNFIFLELTTRN